MPNVVSLSFEPVYIQTDSSDGGCLPVSVSKLTKYYDIPPPIKRHWISAIHAAKDDAIRTLRASQEAHPTLDMLAEERMITDADFGDWDTGHFAHSVVDHLFRLIGQLKTIRVCHKDIIKVSHEPFLVHGVLNPGYFFNMDEVASDRVYTVAVIDMRVHSTFTNHRGKRITVPVAHIFDGGIFKSVTEAYYVVNI